jgi:ABC-2 type transport system permease protein
LNNVFEAAFVIARRDFVATVYTRTFILFLLAPLIMFALAMGVGAVSAQADREATRDSVAVVADSATVNAVQQARMRLVAGTSEQSFPALTAVQPAENVAIQARNLLADTDANYSAVLSGTLLRPVLTGPEKVEGSIGRRIQLIVDEARRTEAMQQRGLSVQLLPLERAVTEQAAGNLRSIRHFVARSSQMVIFFITLMLATLLLSNLVEEKSNKVIEVLAAAVPLDAVFLGKLLAMLAMSVVGLVLWGGLIALGSLLALEIMPDWAELPPIAPAVGWPVFSVLVILYYSTNYMLLGALFLGIGGQANSVREVQTLSMPITFLQMMVLLLAMTVVGNSGGIWYWLAYIFPLSSPLSMIALAAQSELVWPHLVALAWQALWVVLIIRLASHFFRTAVMKSGSSGPLFSFGRRSRARPSE